MKKHVIVATVGPTFYWCQGALGFRREREYATEYKTSDDAHTALEDEDLTEIASVRTEEHPG